MTSNDTNSPRPAAVVWINERHAIVARTKDGDRISMVDVDRGANPETKYLGHVVHEIGDGERVMIVGPGPMRLALEREYVSISHRPDRLIPVPSSALADGAEIVDRLRRLAA